MHAVSLQAIDKRFEPGEHVLSGVNLDVEQGELLALLGPSGCGKSTLLRLIAGLEQPDRGTVLLQGEEATQTHPHTRDVAMVFQGAPLYPHLTVRSNLAFPLQCDRRGQRPSRVDINQRIDEASSVLAIDTLLDRKPHELSGGQRHRVALAKLFVRRAGIWLLDEPLSGLDEEARREVRSALVSLHAQLKPTVVLVTHDLEDALHVGHRVAVMDAGLIAQVGPRDALLRLPETLGVAKATTPGTLFMVQGEIDSDGTWCADGSSRQEVGGFAGVSASKTMLACPPDSMHLGGAEGPAGGWEAVVCSVRSLVGRTRVTLELVDPSEVSQRGRLIEVDTAGPSGARVNVGDVATVRIDHERVFMFGLAGEQRRVWPPASEVALARKPVEVSGNAQKPSD